MKPGKVVALAVMGFLGWQHQEALGPHLGLLKDVRPLVMTYAEMRQYRPALISEIGRNGGQPPRNSHAFLDQRFNRGERRASVDLWGTGYRIERGDFRRYYLRSCGPDRQCRSGDDLVTPLFEDTQPARAGA